LKMDVVLTDVQVQLPPLPEPPSPLSPKVDPFPQLFPDGRIHKPITNYVKKPNSNFSYDVAVRTLDARPIQLRGMPHVAKAPIPVSVNLQLSDRSPPSGDVRVLGFPVELFKQKMRVERFNLALRNPAKDSELDGALSTRQGDYTFTVLVLGTTAKPQVHFMSDPPLAEDQILAVMLYGQKLESLDPDQSSSVGNTQAALVSGAMTLGALYYLSGLPIQRIDYDPKTKAVGVTVSLGEGTSLNVADTGGQESVGIRRRLSRRWAVTTRLDNPADPTDRTMTALLEWAYQY